MSLTLAALLAVAFAIATFFIANAQKARSMSLPQLLDFAVKAQATEVIMQVGEPVELRTPAGPRTLFGSTTKQADFDKHVLERLKAMAREELKAKGRYEWRFDEKGIGKVVAQVEPTKAVFVLPRNARSA